VLFSLGRSDPIGQAIANVLRGGGATKFIPVTLSAVRSEAFHCAPRRRHGALNRLLGCGPGNDLISGSLESPGVAAKDGSSAFNAMCTSTARQTCYSRKQFRLTTTWKRFADDQLFRISTVVAHHWEYLVIEYFSITSDERRAASAALRVPRSRAVSISYSMIRAVRR
jgi:hypothetical protein